MVLCNHPYKREAGGSEKGMCDNGNRRQSDATVTLKMELRDAGYL